jgi:hypothetical protein
MTARPRCSACPHSSGAGEEILDHLSGHCARISADATVRDTVVRSEYHRRRLDDGRLERSLHGTNLSRERFETAEGAQWFRQRVEPSAGGGTHRLVGRRNGIEPEAAADRETHRDCAQTNPRGGTRTRKWPLTPSGQLAYGTTPSLLSRYSEM